MTETQTGETSWWPVITAEAASGWRKLSDDLAAGYDTDRALVEGWWREAWARTFRQPPFWAALPVPVAEVVPPENDGLRLTESGHTDPAAASEGDVAAVDLPRAGESSPGAEAPTVGPRPGQPDLPGQPTGNEPVDVRDVNALPGESGQTAVMPAAAALTETFTAVTDSTGEATS